ncbi:MAG: ATP synthase F1 subunit epsilon [Balneolaceae bacterium]|nr:ATP synthase F1 subunit epsilon [Balneolaceae bacterium]
MEKVFKAQLLTPDGPKFEGDAVSVQIPGSLGKFQVLYNHAPLVSSMGLGEITITQKDGTELHYAVNGGFVEISDNLCTLLAEKAELAEEIDKVETTKIRNELKQKLQTIRHNREEAELELAIVENKLKIASF